MTLAIANSTVLVRDSVFVRNQGIPSPGITIRSEDTAIGCISRIESCSFELNRGYFGGVTVLHQAGDSRTIISDCFFLENTAVLVGGAVYLNIFSAKTPAVLIERTTFRSNRALFVSGGALQIDHSACGIQIRFHSLRFFSNSAIQGGGHAFLILSESIDTCASTIEFVDCHFRNNTGQQTGSAQISVTANQYTVLTLGCYFINCSFVEETGGPFAFVGRGDPVVHGTAVFRDCLFDGGARSLRLLPGSNTVERCVFRHHFCALNLSATSDVQVSHCLFADNHAFLSGGAILMQMDSVLSVRQTTFRNNSANSAGSDIYGYSPKSLTVLRPV